GITASLANILLYAASYEFRSVFLQMVRRAPSCTLFPYTTLFRSGTAGPGRRGARADAAVPQARRRDRQDPLPAPGRGGRLRRRRDRKSTRLNSSHVKISYAVFCLKKKKR